MKRLGAGLYTTTINGKVVDVEFMTTAYGDKGWFTWIDGERSDCPLPTKRAALEQAQAEPS